MIFKSLTFAGEYPTTSRSYAMADASVVFCDINSIFSNQAGLSFLLKPNFSVGLANRYFVKEINTRTFAAGFPTQSGTWAVAYSYFGYSKYNENKVGLAYAKDLKIVSVGLQLDYFYTQIADEYGSKGIPAAEVGILSEPVENFFVAAHVFNPWRAKMTDSPDEHLPTILKIGLGYDFSGKFLLTFESEKDLDKTAIYKMGAEYRIFEKLFLRTGISAKPVLNTFGLGLKFSRWNVDIAFSRHEYLGYSSQINVGFIW